MFGSSYLFGQPSNPFGSQTQSGFAQTNNASSNPFATSTPFGSSMFTGNSTGMFGVPQGSSPFAASSQPFGVVSSASSGPFGFQTQSGFGQNHNASNNQMGSSMFGGNSTGMFGVRPVSSPFGITSSASSGQPSNPFGSQTRSGFGQNHNAMSSSMFSASPASNPFAPSSQPFGNSTPFGVTSSGQTSSFSNPFGNPTQQSQAFTSPTPGFGTSSSASSFSFGTSPAFAQSTSAFNSTQSPFGVQTPTEGTRVMPYATTPMTEDGKPSSCRLTSISGMPVYVGKCHEELRLEDYQKGDKGGQRSTTQPSLFAPSPVFAQPSASPFQSSTSTNPFAMKTPTTSALPSPFGQPTASSTTTNVFGPSVSFATTSSQPFASSSNPGFASFPSTPSQSFFTSSSNSGFPSSSSTTTDPFGSSPGFATAPSQTFASSSSPGFSSFPSATSNLSGSSGGFAATPSQSFASSSNPGFTSFPSTTSNLSGSTASFATTPSQPFPSSSNPGFTNGPTSAFSTGFSLTNNKSPALFSSNPGFNSSPSTFGPVPLANGSTPAFSNAFNFNNSQSSGLFSSTPSMGPNSFSTPSTGMANLFSSTPSFTTNQSSQPYQTATTTSFPVGAWQVPASSNSVVMQPVPATNPFGTLPPSPQISISQSLHSIQYGISSRPVVDLPAPVRSLLTSRNILQRRVRPLPVRKYRPGDDGPKVPFFSDEENSYTPKADAFFIPRENPRALLIRPVASKKTAAPKDFPTPLQENKSNNGIQNENHRGEDKNSSSSGVDIESLMPKLQHSEYFTEPRIQELAAKERADPGYCMHVKEFVVGRHGYGNIKFLGETDVRKLDLDSLVQFNNREVLVYMDESKKPPVGEGLNKPAEVTLLNVKCFDKKSGKQVKEGTRVDKYREMLKRKAEEQGAEFVSYDAVNGEWKFRVQHFN